VQLPPGHLLVWEPGAEARVSRYWSPPSYAGAPPEPRDQAVAELSELLERSTRSRMISDVPLGVFLSGGLDSTLIAALAARVAPGMIQTFTVGYDLGGVSEVTPARRVATALGTEHHELVLTATDVSRQLEVLAARLDQPIADQAIVAMYALAQFTRERVTVAIGGEGADELFFGYPRYRWLSRAARLHEHLPAAAGRRAEPLAGRLPRRARRLGDVLAPVSDAERHFDWVTSGRRHWRERLYGPRLAGQRESRTVVVRVEQGLSGARELSAGLAHFDQLVWLPDDVLAKADRAGMLASLEIRTPYLSQEIAEFASSVAPAEHARSGGKALLRRLLDHVRPGLLDNRPKTAFRVPAREWLRGPLMPMLREQVAGGSLYRDGWIDRAAIEGLVSEHETGADRSDEIWPLLVLGLWMDRGVARA
jgi:asparagine synthase (glutamine-hydrolysing)